MLAVQLLVGVICGIIASLIASRKGRNIVGWFFAGFFIGLIGVIIVACLSNLKAEKARLARAESERRRLREQLRQEKFKNESFRQYSMGRVDAHDPALGVDTRSRQALPGGIDSTEAALRQLAGESDVSGPSLNPAGVMWYYEITGQTNGPIPAVEIENLLNAGKITAKTLLWAEGLSEWTPLNQVETFRSVGNP